MRSFSLSWPSLLLLLLCGLFRVFLSLCASSSSPQSFFSFGSVSLALLLSSSLLPSCLTVASPIFVSQWHTTFAVRGPLADSHAVLLLFVVGSFGEPLQSSFLVILFCIVFYTSSTPLPLSGSLSSSMRNFSVSWTLSVYLGFRLSLLLVLPSCCRLFVSPGSSRFGIAFLQHFRLPSAAPALSLSLPHFFSDTVHVVRSTPSVSYAVSLFLVG